MRAPRIDTQGELIANAVDPVGEAVVRGYSGYLLLRRKTFTVLPGTPAAIPMRSAPRASQSETSHA